MNRFPELNRSTIMDEVYLLDIQGILDKNEVGNIFPYTVNGNLKSYCMQECIRRANNVIYLFINNKKSVDQSYYNTSDQLIYKYLEGIDLNILYVIEDKFIKKINNNCPNAKFYKLSDEEEYKGIEKIQFTIFDNNRFMNDDTFSSGLVYVNEQKGNIENLQYIMNCFFKSK